MNTNPNDRRPQVEWIEDTGPQPPLHWAVTDREGILERYATEQEAIDNLPRYAGCIRFDDEEGCTCPGDDWDTFCPVHRDQHWSPQAEAQVQGIIADLHRDPRYFDQADDHGADLEAEAQRENDEARAEFDEGVRGNYGREVDW